MTGPERQPDAPVPACLANRSGCRVFFSLYFATVCSIPLRQVIVLGDSSAPHVEGLPALSVVLLMLLGPLMPVLGIATANERAQAVVAVVSAAGIFFNLSRL